MLTKIKDRLEPLLRRPASRMCRVPPNALTAVGGLLALCYLYAVLEGASPLLSILLLVLSAAVDAVDGVVARACGSATEFGAFLDSVVDRCVDAVYSYSLYAIGICSEWEAFLFLVASYMVSYARARGESLGVSMRGVGIMERVERVLLIIAIVALAYYAGTGVARLLFLVSLFLVAVTVLQRVARAYAELARRSAYSAGGGV